MIRVSSTTLESFRRVLGTEYGSEAELVAQIKGEPFQATWQMAAGKAWHSLLERCHLLARIPSVVDEDRPVISQDGFSFDIRAAIAAHDCISDGLAEVKGVRTFATAHGPANLVAKVDRINGLVITEAKTKFSTPDARDYEACLQWRCELAVHHAQCVRYVLFNFSDPKDGYCKLNNIVSFRFWQYANLDADVTRWLNLFLGWCDSRGLIRYLHREGTST